MSDTSDDTFIDVPIDTPEHIELTNPDGIELERPNTPHVYLDEGENEPSPIVALLTDIKKRDGELVGELLIDDERFESAESFKASIDAAKMAISIEGVIVETSDASE